MIISQIRQQHGEMNLLLLYRFGPVIIRKWIFINCVILVYMI